MRRFMLGACTAAFFLGAVTACPGQDIPWKPKATSGESVTPGDLKQELSPWQYARVVKPIESRIAMAKKAMEPYEKEMARPEEKRRQHILIKCKERAASYYLAASRAAQSGAHLVKKESLKAALKEQYEEPNKQKAIDIYLGLALDAHTGGDLKGAVAYYVKILSIDRENTEAKSALAKLADQYQQAIKDSKRAGSKGGGSDDNDKPWDTEDYSGAGRGYSGGWGDIGRSGW